MHSLQAAYGPYPESGVRFQGMVHRLINPSQTNSFFLFGARGVGKSFWLDQRFLPGPSILRFDLLSAELENSFSIHPEEFRHQILEAHKKNPLEWVIVDEIQKCPSLLNYVHQLIEKEKIKFALSGSNPRRLKQKGVNLLAGRALLENLYPLTSIELGDKFNLEAVLTWGSLPKLLELQSAQDKEDYLRSYALLYVQNEVHAEQWVKNLIPFRKFLPVAAQMNNKILNYSKIAKDLGVDWTTVKNYFDIMEETWIGFRLESYDESVRVRQRQAPKFYFFDIGIKRAFDNTLHLKPTPQTFAYGDAFEHFIILEIFRLNNMLKRHLELFYLTTKDDAEIDLIIKKPGEPTRLIEIKSKDLISQDDAKGLSRFLPEFPNAKAYIFSKDPVSKKIEGIECLPWELGLKELGF